MWTLSHWIGCKVQKSLFSQRFNVKCPPPLPLGCDRISTIIQLEGLVEIEYRIIASSIAIEKEKKKQKKEKKTEKRKKKRKKEKKTEKRKKKNRKKKKKQKKEKKNGKKKKKQKKEKKTEKRKKKIKKQTSLTQLDVLMCRPGLCNLIHLRHPIHPPS